MNHDMYSTKCVPPRLFVHFRKTQKLLAGITRRRIDTQGRCNSIQKVLYVPFRSPLDLVFPFKQGKKNSTDRVFGIRARGWEARRVESADGGLDWEPHRYIPYARNRLTPRPSKPSLGDGHPPAARGSTRIGC